MGLIPLFFHDPAVALAQQAPEALWTALLLAQLLSLKSMLSEDHRTGCLEQIILGVDDIYQLISSKGLAHFCLQGIPILLITPLCAFMLHMPWFATGVLCLTFVLGLPILILLGFFLSVLMLIAESSAALSALILFPLMIPVLILSVGTVLGSMASGQLNESLLFLFGMFCFSLALLPLLIAQALKLYSHEQPS